MPRMVLLLHTLPDGSSHYDWMIDPPVPRPRAATSGADPNARDLVTFRVQERIDLPRVDAFEALRLENHRRLYLTFEGDIGPAPTQPAGPSRGTVKRIARGNVTRYLLLADGTLEIRGTLGPRGERLWRGRPERAINATAHASARDRWAFTCVQAPQPRLPGSKALDEYDGYSNDFGNWSD